MIKQTAALPSFFEVFLIFFKDSDSLELVDGLEGWVALQLGPDVLPPEKQKRNDEAKLKLMKNLSK